MAEPGSRTPASDQTELENMNRLLQEQPGMPGPTLNAARQLRQELLEKGLKGFKKGGKVTGKGGVVHPGEYVIAQPAAAKLGTKALNRLNQAGKGATTGPAPLMPPAGATDGLGMGQGGLAIHPSLKAHNIAGREPRHTSKLR